MANNTIFAAGRILLTLVVSANAFSTASAASGNDSKKPCQVLLTGKDVAPLSFHDIDKQVSIWKAALRRAEQSEQIASELKILTAISRFAAKLIQDHRNAEFFYLVKQIEFPINMESYEDNEVYFTYYGVQLLEYAILFHNHEVYAKLPSLSKESGWSRVQHPHINRWNQVLTAAVLEDPVFFPDAQTIAYRRGGPEFDGRMADYGRLTLNTIQFFQKAKETLNLADLKEALMHILPSGTSGVHVVRKDGPSTGHLAFEYATPKGFFNHNWIHVSIDDSKEFVKHFFGGGHYKVHSKFNLQLDGLDLNEPKKNWVRSIDIESNKVMVLIERDKDGMSYDRGSRFQELILIAGENGRLDRIIIRNGSHMLFKSLWQQQEVKLPTTMVSSSRVSFLGEEDMSENIIQ